MGQGVQQELALKLRAQNPPPPETRAHHHCHIVVGWFVMTQHDTTSTANLVETMEEVLRLAKATAASMANGNTVHVPPPRLTLMV